MIDLPLILSADKFCIRACNSFEHSQVTKISVAMINHIVICAKEKAAKVPVIFIVEILVVMIIEDSRLGWILHKFLYSCSIKESTIWSSYAP